MSSYANTSKRRRLRAPALIGSLLVGLAGLTAAAPAAAQVTTYGYTGATYTAFTDFTTCEVAPCANFTPAMGVNGYFRTSAPLAPNLAGANIAPQIVDFRFTTGLATIARGDPNTVLGQAIVSTDGAGLITAVDFGAHRWRTAGGGTDATFPYDDPVSKLDRVVIDSATGARGAYNLTCTVVGVTPAGEPGCNTFRVLGPPPQDPGASNATAPYQPFAAGVAPPPVPTLSEWALILFGLMLAGVAALWLQGRRFQT